MISAALLDGAGIGLTIPFLRLLLNEGLSFPTHGLPYLSEISAWMALQSKSTLLIIFGLILLGSLALKSFFGYWAEVLTTFYREDVVAVFRESLYKTFIFAPTSFFDKEKLGTLSNIMNETIHINILIAFVISLATSIFILFAYLCTLILVSWQLTVLIVVLISAIGFGLTRLLGRIKKVGVAVVNARHDLNVLTLDTLAGVRVVKSYTTENYELTRFQKISRTVRDTNGIVARKVVLLEPVTEFLTMAVAMLILIISYVLLISKGLLSTSALMAFMLALIKIIPVTKRINSARGAISQYTPSLATVAQMLRSDRCKPLQSGSLQLPRLKEGISFQNVSFAYDNRSTVLKDFSLDIPCGETVALVGSSGAGKSTVAVLVPRFYDVTSGKICIDGNDICNYDLESLRQRIGIVSQDTYVFNASVRDNIAYGTSNLSEAEVFEAARLANAHEFIQQLPLGYDTLVGDRGVQLSGGQRQRLSIARAILRDPDILILDEATSALDSQSERLVQEALERLRKNRTVIVIAHRLSTIRNADCIVVMQEGKIIEKGKHNELLNRKGTYWSFHNVQSLTVS